MKVSKNKNILETFERKGYLASSFSPRQSVADQVWSRSTLRKYSTGGDFDDDDDDYEDLDDDYDDLGDYEDDDDNGDDYEVRKDGDNRKGRDPDFFRT